MRIGRIEVYRFPVVLFYKLTVGGAKQDDGSVSARRYYIAYRMDGWKIRVPTWLAVRAGWR